ncbi:glycolate oxidase, subunit GlcD [Exophiala sideris]|uniref:D-lactate dehydrogenase (cytochrome) n=1 Tax=Exophiala sideris TaxID=1016849 RepID=A0A0D1WR31_9EURO|nr:glycolate oxidase, subunit GlcD [Exophiala sideris]
MARSALTRIFLRPRATGAPYLRVQPPKRWQRTASQKTPGSKDLGGNSGGFVNGLVIASIIVLCTGTAAFYSGRISFTGAGSANSKSTAPLPSISRLQHDLSERNIEAAKKEFIDILGTDGVDDKLGARIARSSTEWSPAPRGDLDRPCLIVYPRSTEDVSALVKVCHRRKIPIIAFGGGTSLEGTLAAIHGEVCIDFRRMDKVVQLHENDMDVVVQPGIGYVDLNEMLGKSGLFFPPDPGPGAQIGGMISQGCSGTSAYRYGTVKDWVLGLTVVLADGTVIKTRRRPKKSSAGYDLTRLFVGSEGTLGLVTEATLKLTNKPENVRVAVASFPSNSHAVEAAVKIVQKGLPLGAIELLDGISMGAINNSGYCTKELTETPSLFLKFSGSEAVVREQVKQVHSLAQEAKCLSFQFGSDEEESDALWAARKTMLWSLMTLKRNPDDTFQGTDLAVPMSRLDDIIDFTNQKLKESGLVGACCGHVGDGNFHSAIFYSVAEKEKMEKIVSEVEQLAIEMDGTITGEHGIGIEKRDRLNDELGVESVDTMRQVKLALDPLCLLNPEKVVRLTPATPLSTTH